MPENKIERNLPGFYARDEHLVKVKVTDTENPKNIKVFYVPKGTTFKGNTVEAKFDVDTEIKMAKYQMAAMEAAAEGDRFGGSESRIIDLYDSTGAAYGFDVTEKLMEYGSNYKVSRNQYRAIRTMTAKALWQMQRNTDYSLRSLKIKTETRAVLNFNYLKIPENKK